MISKIMQLIMGDSELSDDAAKTQFALRYKLGFWFAVLPAFGFFGSSFLASKFPWGVYILLFGFLCFLTVFAYVVLLYRCPRCGTVPTSTKSGTTGILLFPKKCSKCKAPLLPDHRWGQD